MRSNSRAGQMREINEVGAIRQGDKCRRKRLVQAKRGGCALDDEKKDLMDTASCSVIRQSGLLARIIRR